MNVPVPYEDWDKCQDEEMNVKTSLSECYKKRFLEVKKEMILSQMVSLVFMIIMLVPLWYTGINQ